MQARKRDQIVNLLTGQVIGTGSNTNDANLGNDDVPDVQLENAGAAANAATQYWHLTEKPDETVTLLNKSGGRAAAIWTGTATAGQRIGQWVDDTTTGQWNVIENPNGTVTFQSNADPSLYLTGSSTGAPLTLETGLADGSQDWELVPEGTGGGSNFEEITSRHSGLCLDVDGSSTADGGNVQQWTCTGGANQHWELQDVGGGYVEIVNRNSGLCLDVNEWSTADGANVQQWSCHGGVNQQWEVEDLGESYVEIVNRNSGLCLDVSGWSTVDGGNVQQWSCHVGANQQWQPTAVP